MSRVSIQAGWAIQHGVDPDFTFATCLKRSGLFNRQHPEKLAGSEAPPFHHG
jgi:hypothetical protein